MYLYQSTNKKLIHIFQLQKSNTLHLENICYYFFNENVFLFELRILIQ